jgi:hypothetical protein
LSRGIYQEFLRKALLIWGFASLDLHGEATASLVQRLSWKKLEFDEGWDVAANPRKAF